MWIPLSGQSGYVKAEVGQVITREPPVITVLALVIHTILPDPQVMIFNEVYKFVVTMLDTPDVLTKVEEIITWIFPYDAVIGN